MPASPVIPSAAWTRRLDDELEDPGTPTPLNLFKLFDLIPVIQRIRKETNRLHALGREPVADFFNPPNPGPTLGVPLGGLGSGSVTRGWRGGFNRWHLQAGMVEYRPVTADQFSLFVRRPGERGRAQVLNPDPPPDDLLAAWGWGMDPASATYHALFPRAWTVYEELASGLRLTCRQVAPFIPHDYQTSTTPAGVFVWTLENTGETPLEASLMFTFQNGTGGTNDRAGGHHNELFQQGAVTGVVLHHMHRQRRPLDEPAKDQPPEFYEDPLAFAIAAQGSEEVAVTYRTRFATNGSGMDVWGDFAHDGRLDNVTDPAPAPQGRSIGAALAATVTVPPGETREVAFALAWDMPLARFGLGRTWYRRYTRHYGRAGDAAPRIASDALAQVTDWEQRIEAWQARLLESTAAPDWFKMALLNEAYYLLDGGTLWVDALHEDSRPEGDLPPVVALVEEDMGLFGYLESHEYRMLNTYDVHFYASFALAMLFPLLELNIQRQFARALDLEYDTVRRLTFSNKEGPRKVRGAIPHDIGGPTEDPWFLVNVYNFQDVSRWKDLNPKFVLQVYRDVIATADDAFAREMWPAVVTALEYTRQFDVDEDGLIENEGYPDQTYDAWEVDGPSAYSGGLWLAALRARAALGERLGELQTAARFRAWLDRGREAYEELLWNGEYYDYDASRSRYHDSVMADQLAGHWYTRACGLEGIVPEDHARLALETIFRLNVLAFEDGERGAVNGMRPDGRVDTSCIQSQEVWTGTSYALAASMLQEGLDEQAFQTAEGVVRSVYEELGYWFATPEAWTYDRHHRSMAYMRPLAIWAMQWALERR